jgi:hypothetical protein
MVESMRYFEGRSELHRTLVKLQKNFDKLGISYVVIGGMALAAHGSVRMTEDIDVLVTRSDLAKVHERMVGRGYVRLFEGSKHVRDAETRVKIEFVIAGGFPGDGKPKPISFPDPADAEPVEHDGVKFIGLARLIELKLASGMTGGPERAKDLVDVQQLVTVLHLPRDFTNGLNPAVHAKFHELWDGLHATRKRYIRLWRNKFLTLDAESLDDMIAALDSAAAQLRQMQDDGVVLDPEGGTGDDYALLVTFDRAVAEKYDMHEESEFFDNDLP